MDNFFYDTANIAIALSEIKIAEASWGLVVVGMRLELRNRFLRLTLDSQQKEKNIQWHATASEPELPYPSFNLYDRIVSILLMITRRKKSSDSFDTSKVDLVHPSLFYHHFSTITLKRSQSSGKRLCMTESNEKTA